MILLVVLLIKFCEQRSFEVRKGTDNPVLPPPSPALLEMTRLFRDACLHVNKQFPRALYVGKAARFSFFVTPRSALHSFMSTVVLKTPPKLGCIVYSQKLALSLCVIPEKQLTLQSVEYFMFDT